MTRWAPNAEVQSADGTRITLYRQEASQAPKADVLLVHGLADHMGRYSHVAEAFAVAGFRVTGVDLRGNGLSDGKRGHVMAWQELVDDLAAAAQSLPTPPVVVAHSMGGLVALDYARAHPVPALILSAPLLKPKVAIPAWKKAAARLLNRLLPAVPMGNELDAKAVSRHPEVIHSYDTDPLVYHTTTPRWYREMLNAGLRNCDGASGMTTPLLCMWGSGEKIVDPEAIAQLCSEWGGPVDTRVWDGLYHEIFNEPERAEVLKMTTTWLSQRFS